jgi:putative transposase
MRVILGGTTHWLWRAVNEHGDVLDVLLQEHRDTGAAKRFFRRLIDDQGIPERIVTDGLRSYGAALRELPELDATEHVTVSAAARQNNLIEQSHRPTRDQERQQRGFRGALSLYPCRSQPPVPPYPCPHTSTGSPSQLATRLWFMG